MEQFFCPQFQARLAASSCAGRHKLANSTKTPGPMTKCAGCPIGAAHRRKEAAPGIEYTHIDAGPDLGLTTVSKAALPLAAVNGKHVADPQRWARQPSQVPPPDEGPLYDAPMCECGARIVRRPGQRGRLASRCDECSSKPRAKPVPAPAAEPEVPKAHELLPPAPAFRTPELAQAAASVTRVFAGEPEESPEAEETAPEQQESDDMAKAKTYGEKKCGDCKELFTKTAPAQMICADCKAKRPPRSSGKAKSDPAPRKARRASAPPAPASDAPGDIMAATRVLEFAGFKVLNTLKTPAGIMLLVEG